MSDSRFNTRGGLRKGAALLLLLASLVVATALMFLTPSPTGLAQRPGDTSTVISPIRTPTHTPVPRATPTVYNIQPITDETVWLALQGRYRWLETPEATRQPEAGQRAPDVPFTYVMPLAMNDYSLRNIGWKGFGLGSGIPVDVAAMKSAWYYSWGPNETRLPEPEFLPMVWCADKGGENHSGEVHWSPAAVADRARRFPGRIWLIYNEPERTGLSRQSQPPQCNADGVLCGSMPRGLVPDGQRPVGNGDAGADAWDGDTVARNPHADVHSRLSVRVVDHHADAGQLRPVGHEDSATGCRPLRRDLQGHQEGGSVRVGLLLWRLLYAGGTNRLVE